MGTVLNSPDHYTIGWIAALPIERAAATALLDERHEEPKGFYQHPSDKNSYTWGQVGKHNIVIASLPAGVYGTTSAATTAASLLSSLPQIRIGLLVGIGGGIARPDQDRDIRLGDVAVSQPGGKSGGVIQYDLGKAKVDGTWEMKGSLNMPPSVLLHALASLQAEHEISPSRIPSILQQMWTNNPQMAETKKKASGYVHQGLENDRLFKPTYDHNGGSTCETCDLSREIKRDQRETTDPEIHYGIIASGNVVVKDAISRDSILEVIEEECICFEMEAAGLMNHFPCLVIRGICDYADSHKNDRWQRYASATAAAYAKELLSWVPARQLQETPRAIDVLESIGENVEKVYSTMINTKEQVQSLHETVRTIDQKIVLDRLPIAAGASFDSSAEEHSPFCLPSTRVELLRTILEWADDPNTKPVFWLNGMAGTGKSTISRTVARSFAMERRLGASFFFKRGEADRGSLFKFFTTIAADLIVRKPAITSHIKNTIDTNPAIIIKKAEEQLDKLILQPLSLTSTKSKDSQVVVFVIDGLDECDREEDIRLLVHLLIRAKTSPSTRLKFFLTSRPELPIRLEFRLGEGEYQDLILHEIPEHIIGRDIAAFLEHELAKIRNDYNASVPEQRQLSMDWPSPSNVQSLVIMAIPLFIFAATVCRFLADRKCGNPKGQLEEVLLLQTKTQGSQLEATYLPILNKLVVGLSSKQQQKVLQDFRDIIGAIVLLATPLSTATLAQIINISKSIIDDRLDLLHSVLSIPASAELPVRLLHLSFRDFLVDSENSRKTPFWIDRKKAHEAMVTNCLRILSKCLKQDICDLKAPGSRRSTICPQKIRTYLPPEVQYACLYWVYHVKEAEICLVDIDIVHEFLKSHFLHWVEALSLIDRAPEIQGILKILQSLLKPQYSQQLSNLLADAKQFTLAYVPVIDSTPLQLYSSLLIFTPERNMVRTIFQRDIARWISLKPAVGRNWSQCLEVFDSNSDAITSVRFSHDSNLIISCSKDQTIRIWRSGSGECIRILRVDGPIYSIAFSIDSKLISAEWGPFTTQIWQTSSGESLEKIDRDLGQSLLDIYHQHEHFLVGESMSYPDALYEALNKLIDSRTSTTSFYNLNLLASGSSDRRDMGVYKSLLNLEVRKYEDQKYEGLRFKGLRYKDLRYEDLSYEVPMYEDPKYEDLSFEDPYFEHPDSEDLYFERTPKEHPEIEDETAYIPVLNSRCSKLLAAVSRGNIIEIKHVDSNKDKRILRGHSDQINSIAFSHDSKLLASGSSDRTIRTWRVDTGKCTNILEEHSDLVNSIAFSHDSKLLVSGSNDRTIRTWRVVSEEESPVVDRRIAPSRLRFSLSMLSSQFEDDSRFISRKEPTNTLGFGVSMDGHWITWNAVNLLWIPSEVRSDDLLVSDSKVALFGSPRGAIVIGFDINKLPFPDSSC